MWRWVTRGLVLTLLALLTPALLAQNFGFIGDLERPDPNAPQSGIVPVKGWAYDPQQISKIELWVDDQFQHELVLRMPRLDIVEAYPNWPGIHNSMPGFQTGFLASRFSNGPHTVAVRVYRQGVVEPVELGRRTINIDNTINQTPFGSLDQPDGMGVYNTSGSFPVAGWAADADGVARVDVLIDHGIMQAALHGDARPDVGAVYPDFPGAWHSGFVANVDTTRIQDGMHELSVIATDRNGVSKLIGRRTVQILNNEANLKPFGYVDIPFRDATLYGTQCGGAPPLVSPPVRPQQHLTNIRGWALDLGTRVNTGRVALAELLIDGVRWASTDDCGLVAGQYANCYGLPRYDVQRFYPNYPDAPLSGFNFVIDIGALFQLGVREGHHTIKVRVLDQQQTVTELPGPQGIPVFFKCAETSFDFPAIGWIDVPTKFDYMGGTVVFQGWAAEETGLVAIEIIIDGNYVGQAQLGFPRPDVAQYYPGVRNIANSGWRFTMDTSKLSNARHRLTARVLDSVGNRSELGSVDFYTYNPNITP